MQFTPDIINKCYISSVMLFTMNASRKAIRLKLSTNITQLILDKQSQITKNYITFRYYAKRFKMMGSSNLLSSTTPWKRIEKLDHFHRCI